MKNRDVADVWNKYYLDVPYKIGGQNSEEGYDCISLVYTFYAKLGIDIYAIHAKTKYNQITPKNYLKYWNGSTEDTELLRDWALSLGEKVSEKYRIAGDLLICYFENEKQWFLSIYLGNDLCSIISIERKKIMICPYLLLKKTIFYTVRLKGGN